MMTEWSSRTRNIHQTGFFNSSLLNNETRESMSARYGQRVFSVMQVFLVLYILVCDVLEKDCTSPNCQKEDLEPRGSQNCKFSKRNIDRKLL